MSAHRHSEISVGFFGSGHEITSASEDVECPMVRVPVDKTSGSERIYARELHDWRMFVIRDEAYWYCTRCRKTEIVS